MPWDCGPCGRPYKTKEALKQHLRDSPAHPPIRCNDCRRTFRTSEALQHHLRDSPAHIPTFDCTDCNKKFDTDEALQQHLRDSPAHILTFDCIDCDRNFNNDEALQQHLRDSPAHTPTSHDTDSDRTRNTNKGLPLSLPRRAKSSNAWFMYPSLHDEVSRLLEMDNLSFRFHEADQSDGSVEQYDSNVMGRFTCNNGACSSKGWPSMVIAITIRMYPGKQYNARVYNQRCKSCSHLGQPALNDTYAERVAYRLKTWCGIPLEPPPYNDHSKGPHQSLLCEGCKDGHCNQQDRNERR